MTDLSKCAELVNGWPIVYGPVYSSYYECWECVVQHPNTGRLITQRHDLEGGYYDDVGGANFHFNLKLPEPEWIYVRPFNLSSGNCGYRNLIECVPENATHRYQAGKPETMERVDE